MRAVLTAEPAHQVRATYGAAADEDYLVARWAAQSGLLHQFCWSAAQCLEKFIKTFLLLQKIRPDKTGNGHNVTQLLLQVRRDFPNVVPASIQLKLPKEIIEGYRLGEIFHLNEFRSAEEIVAQIDEMGSPTVRYRSAAQTKAIFAIVHYLDEIVFHLRVANEQMELQPPDKNATFLDVATARFDTLLFTSAKFRAQRAGVLAFQNGSFFPEYLDHGIGPIFGAAVRNNSLKIALDRANRLSDERVLEDFEWLKNNSKDFKF